MSADSSPQKQSFPNSSATAEGGTLATPGPEADSHPSLLVGMDWADESHVYAMLAPDGQIQRGEVAQSAEAICQLFARWRKKYGELAIDVCLETSRGAVINALLEQPGIRIYPVNPGALANYRKAFAHGGGKNDPVDAALILQYLQYYRAQLRPLDPGLPLTRELAALCQQRRGWVELRVALVQQLIALLKCYFPAILALDPAKPYADFVLKLLLKFPTLEQAQAAGRTRLRKLFFGLGSKQKIEQRLDILLQALPLSRDPVLLRICARQAQNLCTQLWELNLSIRRYDHEIRTLLPQHEDYLFVKSLPCGAKSQARIIASLGDDRRRFGSADELAAATGIAPLTIQSGKSRYVSARWACSKFLRQTFHEFAGVSIGRSNWAKAYYEQQLAAGKSSRVAKRALAYKWIRIIFRCWQDKTPYQESHYVNRLFATHSPLAKTINQPRPSRQPQSTK